MSTSDDFAGDVVGLYDHWLHNAQAKGMEDCQRDALWNVVTIVHAALVGDVQNEADRAWRVAYSRHGAANIRRAISEAEQRLAARPKSE